MRRKKKIRDIGDLNKEIAFQKKRALKLQLDMDGQLQHLKDHSGSMFWNTVVGQSFGKRPVMAAAIGAIIQNDKVQGLIKKLTGKLADFIGKATASVFVTETDADKNENHS